ncbi:hypothetical protein RM780_25000 [Streptomyces sp. DSM 44917]|uniref:Anaphase-promoting complex subunit 4 WD40 domain-containing protein n=1 Tax=Streptomyces boetiae TaxID=3075541 RepID=A0ABU2LFF6_9ACTN|nr:hypothetical protein [Streptomyces sp. DSM 44917]MDT0310185.1 hypothetical protein [Streptomyces sp. DSM 44917]
MRLWDITGNRLLAELAGHTDRVYAVAYGPGDAWLASASWDGTAIVRRDGEIRHRLRGHTGPVLSLAFSPSGELLASGGEDGTVRLWTVPPEGPPTRASP